MKKNNPALFLIILCLFIPFVTVGYCQFVGPIGSSGWCDAVAERMANSKTNLFYRQGGPFEMYVVVMKASKFQMKTYVVPKTGVGTIIDDVVADPVNASASVILNGAQFGYGTTNDPKKQKPLPDQEPMVTIGDVVNSGVVVSTNASPGARRLALTRYWLSQDYSVSDGYFGSSYFFSEPPPGLRGDPPVAGAGVGGLVSLIMPTGHIQTQKDDSDLAAYGSFRLQRPLKGGFLGFNIIGVNRSNGLIIIVSKANLDIGSVFVAQTLLANSGVDLALLTDGGGSVACWTKDHGYLTKSSRHTRQRADAMNTVTNYLVFTEKP